MTFKIKLSIGQPPAPPSFLPAFPNVADKIVFILLAVYNNNYINLYNKRQLWVKGVCMYVCPPLFGFSEKYLNYKSMSRGAMDWN